MGEKKRSKPKKQLSPRQQASDDALRRELENFDLRKFDKVLAKAIATPKSGVI